MKNKNSSPKTSSLVKRLAFFFRRTKEFGKGSSENNFGQMPIELQIEVNKDALAFANSEGHG